MPGKDAKPLILDTSVLVNYAHIDRLDLLVGAHVETRVVEQVQTELQRQNQKKALERAITNGTILPCAVEDLEDIAEAFKIVYDDRRGRGEAFSFVYARSTGGILGIDDKRAMSLFQRKFPELATATSKDLMVKAIKNKLITIAEADEIKGIWEQECRYKLLFESFSDLFK
ncbi:MAG: hypothetical protein GC165_01125 [Armatimonadetes bacterium]|nr:hypothetical protein [Armatimonadota bacterium]